MFEILEQGIRRHGLERVADSIRESAKECARLKAEETSEDAMPVGTSKLGGRPDLPGSFEWPRVPQLKSRPLAFLAQINTRELPSVKYDTDLPRDLLLSVFYDAEEQPWGFDPQDRGGWKVIATPLDAQLARQAFPADLAREARFQACRFTTSSGVSVPDIAGDIVQQWNLSEEEDEGYAELAEELSPEAVGANHQMFGHASQIQNSEMALQCQLVSNGIYCGDSKGYSSPEAQQLKPGASEWRLLLQLDSDENANMMWGDSGRLYFWIREADLLKRAFDKVWMILECF